MPIDLQANLLRILQDGGFERLGSSVTIKTDVRIIAATNKILVSSFIVLPVSAAFASFCSEGP